MKILSLWKMNYLNKSFDGIFKIKKIIHKNQLEFFNVFYLLESILDENQLILRILIFFTLSDSRTVFCQNQLKQWKYQNEFL